ncbi:ribonuclease HII [Alteribacter lacisalsi]|uniref:Ribonuclease HII n=1 Tax=Alteribacter lacisalsi TaxID=2045244 RepID=A0A2W0HPW9_9BACI|nr:ribonuclease HII [Alteribacter lacisalsi]PYZ99162.1 ribonuclease HII [Alteribacter lacisalsi]
MKKKSIADIKTLLEHNEPDLTLTEELKKDSRKGVQKLLASYEKTIQKKIQLRDQFREMSICENDMRRQGFKAIAGIDEVGRGPLAGPVIAASVILPHDFFLPGLTDSKKLSETQRESFAAYIKDHAIAWGTGTADVQEIDRDNIYEATKTAMMRAVANMSAEADYLLLDAMKLPLDTPQTSLIKGDSKSISIAAASVIAKVTRDNYMKELDRLHPGYAFASNMGYGTKDHVDGLRTKGITPEHRKSFAPVKACMNK